MKLISYFVRKKTVKISFFILVVVVIFCGCQRPSLESMTETATETPPLDVEFDTEELDRELLVKDVWVEKEENTMQIINFSNDGEFILSTINLITDEQTNLFGEYEISKSDLTLNFDEKSGGETFIYSFLVTDTELFLEQGDDIELFYLGGSANDPRLNKKEAPRAQQANQTQQPVNNNYLPAPNWDPAVLQYQYDNTPKQTICNCCYGTGVCHICEGKGTIGTVPPSKCPACFGSCLCKYCHGTGVLN